MSRQTPTGPLARLMAAGALLGAAVLRFWNLGQASLWYDEAYTWWVASQITFRESLASSVYEIIPPGSYVLWRGWIALTGETEFAMRALSALIGILTVAALGRLVRRLTHSSSTMVIAMVFTAFSPALLWADREVRMYGPLICFSVLSSAALMEVLFSSRRRKLWLSLWALASLASLYMVITAAFWLLAQALYVAMLVVIRAFQQKSREPLSAALRTFGLPSLVIILGFLPWAVAALPSLGANTGYWPGTLTLDAFLKTAVQGMTLHQFNAYPADFFYLVPGETWITGLIVCAIGGVSLLLSPGRWKMKLYPVAGMLALLIQGLVYHNIPKWGVRHATLYAPYIIIALAFAGGVDRSLPAVTATVTRRVLKALPSSILLALALSVYVSAAMRIPSGVEPYHEDWRTAAAYVQDKRLPGDVVIIETGSVYPAWVYYAGDEGLLPLPDEPLLNVYNILCYGNTAPVIEKAIRDASQVWLVTWLDHVTDPTGIVPTLLELKAYEVDTPYVYGLGLRHFIVADHTGLPVDPPYIEIVDTELLPDLTLWGYTLPTDPLPADHHLTVLSWWYNRIPAAHLGRFYQASLRLVDARGHTWLKHDAPPGGGDYRPERWTANTLVLGRFDTPLPSGLAPGAYTVNLIAYFGGDSQDISLGTIQIAKPDNAPQLPLDFTSVHSDRDSALTLIGVRLDQETVGPQDSLNGELFWEVRDMLSPVYGVAVAVGEYHSVPWGIMQDFDATRWQPGDRFRTFFELPVDPRAVDMKAPLDITLYDARGTSWTWSTVPVTIEAKRSFTLPPDASPVDVPTTDGTASLVGYKLPERVRAGEDFEVTLYWRAGVPTAEQVSVFLHITPPDNPGLVIAQHDAQPANNEKPLYTWVTGEIIADSHTVPGIPAGTYIVRTGLYNAETRIDLAQVDGIEISDNGISLPERLVIR